MNHLSNASFEKIKQGLRSIGYDGDLLQENYRFADFAGSDPVVREIHLAAFGHVPTSFESAWIGVTIGNENRDTLRRFHALGAPQIFVLHGDEVQRWKMPATGIPVLQERLPSNQFVDVLQRRKDSWGRDVVAKARALSFPTAGLQLDFYDAGLVPAIESVVRSKLDGLLSEALILAHMAYEEHVSREIDEPGLFRLVFRFLAAKLLEDRGHAGNWVMGTPGDIINRVETYYYRLDTPPPAANHPEVQEAVWRFMRGGLHLQNLSVRTLAYIYENTLVSKELRKQQSIHGTPPEVAEYVVRRLPFESLVPEDRRVFEPFSGHAVFLIAALGRLRELLEPGLPEPERHNYFVRMLAGMEEEPFAIEVARLSLMLADYPNPDGWQLYQRDVFSAVDLESELAKAKVVLCNPPFENFPLDVRPNYPNVRSVNQAAEILRRVLEKPPAMLGFVLPNVIRDGQSFRHVRRRIVETYGSVEVTELPDSTFAHSEVLPIVLVAYGANVGDVELRYSKVSEVDLPRFLSTGEPTATEVVRLTTSQAATLPMLWRSPMAHIWAALSDKPTVGSVAEIHRGIEYRIELSEHKEEVISAIPKEGYSAGIFNVSDRFEPFSIRERLYLDCSTALMRGRSYLREWSKAKVIVNANRHSRGPWRVIAVPDNSGLVAYQNFHGVWPKTSDWAPELLAAVLNGHVANAYLEAHDNRHNRKQTIAAVPVPQFTAEEIAATVAMVKQYQRVRDALALKPSREQLDRCRALLAEIRMAVLRAYRLSASEEAEILSRFGSLEAPGPNVVIEARPTIEQLPLAFPLIDTKLRSRVTVSGEEEIELFLHGQAELRALVKEALGQVIVFFPKAKVVLELLKDPDVDGGILSIGIKPTVNSGEAIQALKRFDEEWWIHNVGRAAGLVCIDVSESNV